MGKRRGDGEKWGMGEGGKRIKRGEEMREDKEEERGR